MPDSCITCPSYIPGDDVTEQKQRFNRPPGGPICGRYGTMLGSAKSTEDELTAIAVTIGSNCIAHGDSRPVAPDEILPIVSVPVTFGARANPSLPDGPDSCRKCVNFVDEQVVYDEWGWNVGLCAAKGMLIFKPLAEARNCQLSMMGETQTSTLPIALKPEYKPGFHLAPEVAMSAFVYVGNSITGEPSECDSDAPVTAKHEADGIRAWRKITDPKNEKRHIFAPVFKLDKFTEEEIHLIPTTGGKGNPELYVDYNALLYQFFVESFGLDETPALVGAPGTGKTQFFRWAAWLCQMPFRRLQFYGDMDVTEMLGTTQFSPEKGTFFEPGVLPIAWTSIGILDFDEPNLAPDPVLQVIRPVTDNSKELLIENRAFQRNDYCFFGMAMNPSYDYRNLGTKELADADTNRLSFLDVQPAPDPVERHIMRTYCKTLDNYDISEETIDLLMKIAADIRELEESNQYPGTWATRQMIKVARKTRWYDIRDAFAVSALNNMPQEVRDLVGQAITTHVGPE